MQWNLVTFYFPSCPTTSKLVFKLVLMLHENYNKVILEPLQQEIEWFLMIFNSNIFWEEGIVITSQNMWLLIKTISSKILSNLASILQHIKKTDSTSFWALRRFPFIYCITVQFLEGSPLYHPKCVFPSIFWKQVWPREILHLKIQKEFIIYSTVIMMEK